MLTLSNHGELGNLLVQGVDFRGGVETWARFDAMDDVAYWLAANDYEWTGRLFVRQPGHPRGKIMFARVTEGSHILSTEELEARVLPLFAREACV